MAAATASAQTPDLLSQFTNPPTSANPWVYWYFMEGAMTKQGMTADLEAMKKARLGGGIMLEVNIGIPKGPVRYMSPEWISNVGFAIREADRLGLGIDFGTGPGWCGSGGPWVKPEDAMQHLVASETTVTGPTTLSTPLPQPKPRTPYFGIGTLTSGLKEQWESFYKDEVVLAMPTPGPSKFPDLDEKSLVYRAPYSSTVVKPFFEPNPTANGAAIASSKIIDLTSKLNPDGTLDWNVPPGKWTILRFGRTLTGTTTRPAPDAGLGFETDKFEGKGISDHLTTFVDTVLKEAGPRRPGRGVTALHWDSWEMGAQNWSPNFRALFTKARGYDPVRYLPVMAGKIVDSPEISERFLWDLRQTGQELVVANHLGTIKKKARDNGLILSVESYDMNPTSDLALGGVADEPMCEFWSKGYGYRTEYSCFEAVSIAHTMGRPVVGAEAFTSDDGDAWLQHPASMKEQGDWALANGINKFYFHRYQHQPALDEYPGMTMGPYGVHWERTQTWWDMVPAYHTYLARCQQMLRQGLPVADVLYLAPEGAPNVFQPPKSATIGDLPDRRGYNFDGCAPEALLARASVKNGRIVFPDGMSYRLLVLPRFPTMTPRLLGKVASLAAQGATLVGNPPSRSPGLSNYPACDTEVRQIAKALWATGRYGKGRVFRDVTATKVKPEPPPLRDARWIWEDQGEPAKSAAVGTVTFVRDFNLPADRPIAFARMTMTADNTLWFSVNREDGLYGTDFHKLLTTDIRKLLRPGPNRLEAKVENTGPTPSPAGLIGALEIRFVDGGTIRIVTDRSWKVKDAAAKDLGPWTMDPWGLSSDVPPRQLFPDYAVTAKLLASLGVVPDLEAGDSLRYSHRRTKEADFYFVSNRQATELNRTATFRTAGRLPEWWDPNTGETRDLPHFTTVNGQTKIPLRLAGFESGFVVFRRSPNGWKVSHSTKPDNFPRLVTVAKIETPWTVDFDPKFGGPVQIPFPKLVDWRNRPEEALRHYSGKAVYRTTFDGAFGEVLSLGKVANIAAVRLNGKDLGVIWSTPWQVAIPPGLLRAKGNLLEVTVANLWVNRLISDSALPPSQRITKTTWSPYRPDSPLIESGLLGPVTLLETSPPPWRGRPARVPLKVFSVPLLTGENLPQPTHDENAPEFSKVK
jgi:hypothetical protein